MKKVHKSILVCLIPFLFSSFVFSLNINGIQANSAIIVDDYILREEDGNEDHHVHPHLNPGETVSMSVGFKNISGFNIDKFTATIDSPSNYVTFLKDSDGKLCNTESYPDIKNNLVSTSNRSNLRNADYAHTSYYSPYDFTFTLSENIPSGTKIPFIFYIKTQSNEDYISYMEIPVYKSDLDISIKKYLITDREDRSKVNNINHKLNRGETVALDIKIINNIDYSHNGLNCLMSCDSPYVSIKQGEHNFRLLQGKQGSTTRYNNTSDAQLEEGHFVFEVSKDAPIGYKVPLVFTFTCSTGEKKIISYPIEVQKVDGDVQIVDYYIEDKERNSSLNNADNKVNKGETIFFNIKLQNKGKDTIKNLTWDVTCDSPYVKLFNKFSKGYLEKLYKESTSKSGNHGFELSKDTPIGEIIPFTFTFVSGNNDIFTDTLNIEVMKKEETPIIVNYVVSDPTKYYNKITKKDENYPNNNNDGTINKGECVFIKPTLLNKGKHKINDLSVQIETSSPYAAIDKDYSRIDIKSLYPSYVEKRVNSFKVLIKDNIKENTTIPLKVTFTDKASNTWEQEIFLPVMVEDKGFEVIKVLTTDKLTHDRYSNETNYSNNEDGIINEGEKVRMEVILKNNSPKNKNYTVSVKGDNSLFSSSKVKEYNNVRGGSYSRGDGNYYVIEELPIFDNEEDSYYFSLDIELLNMAKKGSEVPLTLIITDTETNKTLEHKTTIKVW